MHRQTFKNYEQQKQEEYDIFCEFLEVPINSLRKHFEVNEMFENFERSFLVDCMVKLSIFGYSYHQTAFGYLFEFVGIQELILHL